MKKIIFLLLVITESLFSQSWESIPSPPGGVHLFLSNNGKHIIAKGFHYYRINPDDNYSWEKIFDCGKDTEIDSADDVIVSNNGSILIRKDHSIYYSDDNLKTFHSLPWNYIQSESNMLMDNENNLYAIGYDTLKKEYKGIAKYSIEKKELKYIGPPEKDICFIYKSKSGKLFAQPWSGSKFPSIYHFYSSSDDGKTWTYDTNCFSGLNKFWIKSMTELKGGRLIVSNNYKELFYSDDNGISFQKFNNDTNEHYNISPFGIDNDMLLSMRNEYHRYITSILDIFLYDGTLLKSIILPKSYINSIITKDNDIILSNYWKGIIISQDTGKTWRTAGIENELRDYRIKISNSGNLFLQSEANDYYYLTNSGGWKLIYNSLTLGFFALYNQSHINSDNRIMIADSNKLFIFYDEKLVKQILLPFNCFRMVANDKTLIAVTFEMQNYISNDTGLTWKQFINNRTGSADTDENGYIYLITDSTAIVISPDGFITDTLKNLPVTICNSYVRDEYGSGGYYTYGIGYFRLTRTKKGIYFLRLDYSEAAHNGYFNYYSRIFRSLDKGKSWQKSFESPKSMNSKCFLSINSKDVLFCYDTENFYHSTDDGLSWEKIYDHPIKDIKNYNPEVKPLIQMIIGDDDKLYSVVKYYGIYSIPTLFTNVKEPPVLNEFMVSPNPATDFIEITGSINHTLEGVVSNNINVYNILGERVINEKVNHALPQRLDISSLPIGIYIMKINNLTNNFMILR